MKTESGKALTLGSLFDGIGGFPLCAVLSGITPVWAAEVDPVCVAVTRQHFPKMLHLGDVSKINGAEIPPVDIITFGSPCQDLSVAGERRGLKHSANGDEETTRSGLFIDAIRIIYEMREATNGLYPAYIIWENVEGAFNSCGGRDFQTVLQQITKTDIPIPPSGKWAKAGVVRGRGICAAWRVLGAEYWGVPQRRKRVYLIGSFGTDSAAEILFKRDSVRRYLAPRGEAQQTPTAAVETGVGISDFGVDAYNGSVTEQSATLGCNCGKSTGRTLIAKKSVCYDARRNGDGSIENRYLESVRYKYWEAFFARPEICKKMTGDMQSEFYSRLGELKKIEFNLDNIYELQVRMTKDTIGSIENAIMELFHEFAREHSWYAECAKNIHHYYNGWATNKCGVINKKVIIPLSGFRDNYRGEKVLALDYNPRRKIVDIEKVFSYLDTGVTDCWETVDKIMERAQSIGQSQNIEFKYFTVTFYKKGTAHIVFKDMELLKRFNIFAGQREGGLPPSYGKKAYSDMTEREKAIIDEFQGAEDYNEVLLNNDRYLVTSENLLALGEREETNNDT